MMDYKDRAPSTEEKVTGLEQYEGRPELSPPPSDVKSPDPERWPYYHGWGVVKGVKGHIWSNVPMENEAT